MSFWAIVFGLAAIFNLAAGLPMLLAPEIFFGVMGQAVPGDLMFVRAAGAMIAVFGIGYAMVAHDRQANRGIAVLGAIGKAPMPVIAWFYYQAGAIPFSTFTATLGDLAFAALFVIFLLTTRKQ